MIEKLLIKQVEEGSIIFNKPFVIALDVIEEKGELEFEYIIYCEDSKIETNIERTQSQVFTFYPTNKDSYKSYKVLVEVYKGGKKIRSLFSPVLDFVEDFISIKEVKLERMDDKLVVSVDSNLNLEKETYAYYLDRDSDDALVMIWYSKSKTHSFDLLGPGNYSVRVFTRLAKNNNVDTLILRTNVIYVGE